MIVVTGMHRSGTSLTAQVLEALGANFGPEDQLYEADRWNANGYLERVDAVDLNSRLITGVARTTGRLDAIRSQVSYLRMPGADRIAGRASRLDADLRNTGAALDDLFVKDPRFCLTLPAWRAAGGIDALVVALRHPTASVASLRKRNGLPRPLGHRFWRWHMEAVLPHIDERTLVVQQEVLTGPDHDAEVDRIRRWLADVAGVSTSPDAPGVLDPSLIHHRESASAPAASSALWERLLDANGWNPAA